MDNDCRIAGILISYGYGHDLLRPEATSRRRGIRREDRLGKHDRKQRWPHRRDTGRLQLRPRPTKVYAAAVALERCRKIGEVGGWEYRTDTKGRMNRTIRSNLYEPLVKCKLRNVDSNSLSLPSTRPCERSCGSDIKSKVEVLDLIH